MTGFAQIVNVREKLGLRVEKAAKALRRLRVFLGDGAVEYRRRTQRHQADERAQLQGKSAAVAETQHVVKKSVGFIPHARLLRADARHRRGDRQKIFEELEY